MTDALAKTLDLERYRRVLQDMENQQPRLLEACISSGGWAPALRDLIDWVEALATPMVSSKHTAQCLAIALMFGEAGFPEDIPIQDAVRQLIAGQSADNMPLLRRQRSGWREDTRR